MSWTDGDRDRSRAARKNVSALAEKIRAAIDWHRVGGKGSLRITLDTDGAARPGPRRGDAPVVLEVHAPDSTGGHIVSLTGVTFETEERVGLRVVRAVYEAGATLRSLSADDRDGLSLVVDIETPPSLHLPDGWEVVP